MAAPIDLSGLRPVSEMAGEDEEETRELQALARQAEEYITGFNWCSRVQECYEGIAIGGVVGVFLQHIVPSQPGVDDWLWVVVGDLPPAYIVVDDAPTPDAALEAYIAEMQAWVSAAAGGQPVDALIPVNAPATPESASQLKVRLDFLMEHVLGEDE